VNGPATTLSTLAALAASFVSLARAEEPIDYTRQIKPVFQARCYACHGALKQKGGLRLDTAAMAIRGGQSGAAITPGDVEESAILDRVSATEESERMPPEGEPLKPAEIAALRAWIAQGAQTPTDEEPERDPRDHWAFKAPARPAVPQVENQAWVKNPIDAFIAAEQEKRELAPQPPADRRVWLRRVTLDLIGLPPSREELEAFVADDSVEAEDRVVSRLLASPQYGERWGRHWMDIWRYSDWWGLGAEVRNSQKHIWHWRDWIVESLNEDKGYDQMLREMIAADELYPNDLGRLRASGFLARQYFKFNRTSWLDETIEHTSKALLGLTFNCAKCHDHKYDPFSQVDYYRIRAFFEPYQVRTDAVPGEIDFEKDGIPRAFDCNLDAPTFVHIRGDDRNPDQGRVIQPAFPAFLGFDEAKIEPISLPAEAYEPGLRPFVVEAHREAAERGIVEARAALDAALRKRTEAAQALSAAPFGTEPAGGPLPLDQAEALVALSEKALAAAHVNLSSIQARAVADRARHQQPPPEDLAARIGEAVRAERAAAVAKADEDAGRAELAVLQATPEKKAEAEKAWTAAKTALQAAREAIGAPGESYTPLGGSLKTLESNLETEESRRKPFPKTSTGRRAALARWITDPRHPLPARVAVNHIWARHFGRPLVPTVFDFGRKGTPPTHPELLDWLAVELIESGWSMKHIHRLIVTSNTYRLTSSSAGVSDQTRTADPDNRYYWRANSTRMQAQIIRDSLLSLAGELDLTRGGPSIPVGDETSRRRSLYFVHSHNEHQKFLATFDDASVLECYRRAESIVPQQALALENSPLAVAMAEKIARRIADANPGCTDQSFLRAAFLTVLSVEPSEAEEAAAAEALGRLAEFSRRAGQPDPEARARLQLVLALLNHNDFVTVR
jgi:mono/diheme cytochrome c family protein